MDKLSRFLESSIFSNLNVATIIISLIVGIVLMNQAPAVLVEIMVVAVLVDLIWRFSRNVAKSIFVFDRWISKSKSASFDNIRNIKRGRS